MFINVGRTAFGITRRYSSISPKQGKAVILGVYENEDRSKAILTPCAEQFNKKTDGRLLELIHASGPILEKGKSRIFYDIDKDFSCVSVVGLGVPDPQDDPNEGLDQKRENIRIASGCGARQLKEIGASDVWVDPCGDPEAAAEGATLGSFTFQGLKKSTSNKKIVYHPYDLEERSLPWSSGIIKGEAQTIASELMETPANLMTPLKFSEIVCRLLAPKKVAITVRDRHWIESKRMGAFLSVTRGSAEPPAFLELRYNGSQQDGKPLVLIGKGVTFDSGGINLKTEMLELMRGDMGGGACVVATINALASLRTPINVVGLIALCENMPGSRATKPGDVVTAMNGKTIQVDDTDYEGRLTLADALCYAHEFKPQAILDIATLTGEIMLALGPGATGVFTPCDQAWQLIQKAGHNTGDRVWRMPVYELYSQQMKHSKSADLSNVGILKTIGGTCTAAAFLKEFVTIPQWLHLDMVSVFENKGDIPYLVNGMPGRPTRTLVEFAQGLAENGLRASP